MGYSTEECRQRGNGQESPQRQAVRRSKKMTSKQRSYLKGLAMNLEPIFQIGKSGLTPEITEAVNQALDARELVKITILKNCLDDGGSVAEMLAERTRSQLVQVIGRRIVLYRPAKDETKRKIQLP